VNSWADSVLKKHSDRKAIMIAHSVLNRVDSLGGHFKPGTNSNLYKPNFTRQGGVIYNMAKVHPNVFMMLGGHISGEAFRRDEFEGNTIKTYLADYQARRNAPYTSDVYRNGGGGLMRLMQFNTTKQTIVTTTFAPQADGTIISEIDGDSHF